MTGVVDASVHVMPGSNEEFVEYLSEPWRSRRFPGPARYHYAHENEYWPGALRTGGTPASDPAVVAHDVFDVLGASHAILLPLGRGLHPNTNLAVAICAATNDWLAERFLGSDVGAGRFRGTIRVEPRDPVAAVREIERWAGHPGMVQVGVPLQALQPYGHQSYLPIWTAAAASGLPIVVHSDGGSGADFAPTAAGYPRFTVEYDCMVPLNFGFHLASLIAEGTFSWVEHLTFVFADGGFDELWPLAWRLEKDWKGTRDEVPAARRSPLATVLEHVRFVAHRIEGPEAAAAHVAWLADSEGSGDLLMFGSNYPSWNLWEPQAAAKRIPDAMRERILGVNARAAYLSRG